MCSFCYGFGLVVRELDSLKHKASRFRKESEASLVMQWVEHCMVKMSWWTHVQSSGECFPVSATPPVSPLPQPSQGGRESSGCNATSSFTDNQTSFSSYGSFAEIVSPTVEDHILECALLFKKLKTDGQLVLLTKEVGLRIKAMAEVTEKPEIFHGGCCPHFFLLCAYGLFPFVLLMLLGTDM